MPRRESPKLLDTTGDVLDALGVPMVCQLTGARYKVVCDWRAAETFPSCYFLVMSFALHSKGLHAPPELWRQVTPAQRRQALQAVIAAAQKSRAA